MDLPEAAAIAIYSVFLGVATGLSGLNLGSARFPAVTAVESDIPSSVGTTIGITAIITLTAALSHFMSGNVHRKIFLTLASVGVTGCAIGAYFTVLLPSMVVLLMIAATIPWSIYLMLRSRKHKMTGTGILTRRAYIRQSGVIFAVGSLGGMIGVLPTAIMMSSMIYTMRIEPKIIIGTILAITSVIGIVGVGAHVVLGNINFVILGIMGSAGMIGGVLGVRLATRTNQKKLKTVLIVIQSCVLAFIIALIINELIKPAVIHCNSCF